MKPLENIQIKNCRLCEDFLACKQDKTQGICGREAQHVVGLMKPIIVMNLDY